MSQKLGRSLNAQLHLRVNRIPPEGAGLSLRGFRPLPLTPKLVLIATTPTGAAFGCARGVGEERRWKTE